MCIDYYTSKFNIFYKDNKRLGYLKRKKKYEQRYILLKWQTAKMRE